MMDFDESLTGVLPTLGFGGVAGVVVGYATKKLTRMAAVLLGVLFIAIQFMVYLGWMTVNWGAVQEQARHTWASPEGITLADRAKDVVTANLPFGGGFLAGFAIGFKLG